MGSEEAERLIFLMNKTRVFANELPECLNVAELLDIVQGSVVFLIQTCMESVFVEENMETPFS